jgi:hypothetical protein
MSGHFNVGGNGGAMSGVDNDVNDDDDADDAGGDMDMDALFAAADEEDDDRGCGSPDGGALSDLDVAHQNNDFGDVFPEFCNLPSPAMAMDMLEVPVGVSDKSNGHSSFAVTAGAAVVGTRITAIGCQDGTCKLAITPPLSDSDQAGEQSLECVTRPFPSFRVCQV